MATLQSVLPPPVASSWESARAITHLGLRTCICSTHAQGGAIVNTHQYSSQSASLLQILRRSIQRHTRERPRHALPIGHAWGPLAPPSRRPGRMAVRCDRSIRGSRRSRASWAAFGRRRVGTLGMFGRSPTAASCETQALSWHIGPAPRRTAAAAQAWHRASPAHESREGTRGR